VWTEPYKTAAQDKKAAQEAVLKVTAA